jgi:hypothetical protein
MRIEMWSLFAIPMREFPRLRLRARLRLKVRLDYHGVQLTDREFLSSPSFLLVFLELFHLFHLDRQAE